MSYSGYIPLMFAYLSRISVPRVLEIGVDKGQTLIPVIHGLSLLKDSFEFTGIDIVLNQDLDVIMRCMLLKPDHKIEFKIKNSIDYLKEDNTKYDLMLVDGDHNYETVKYELSMLSENNSHDNSVMIVDDYSGKYAYRDLYYSERDDYASNSLATKRLHNTEKQGVKTAVDEFISQNQDWHLCAPIPGEPIVITKNFDFMQFLNEMKAA